MYFTAPICRGLNVKVPGANLPEPDEGKSVDTTTGESVTDHEVPPSVVCTPAALRATTVT
ncbi:hypothetical protein DRA43_04605 [Micromonospora provocatoris]|nr:hypothetical protein DRA43_04605 [Micromonospora provocatoris]